MLSQNWSEAFAVETIKKKEYLKASHQYLDSFIFVIVLFYEINDAKSTFLLSEYIVNSLN